MITYTSQPRSLHSFTRYCILRSGEAIALFCWTDQIIGASTVEILHKSWPSICSKSSALILNNSRLLQRQTQRRWWLYARPRRTPCLRSLFGARTFCSLTSLSASQVITKGSDANVITPFKFINISFQSRFAFITNLLPRSFIEAAFHLYVKLLLDSDDVRWDFYISDISFDRCSMDILLVEFCY